MGLPLATAPFWPLWHILGGVTLSIPLMPDLLAEITEAARTYYAQANHPELTATDFSVWLDELTMARQAEVLARGLVASRAELGFLRYCLEWCGNDMREFMAQYLSVVAFELWEAYGEFNGDLPPHGIAR